MDIRKLNKKQIKQLHGWVRAAIQLIFFIAMPSAFAAAFNGVKYIFSQFGTMGELQVTAFVAVLIVLCAFTILFGRFFCGFACAFGSFGDAVHALYLLVCKKLKKKPVKLKPAIAAKLSVLKYFILALIVFMCFKGIYSKAKGTSPWDVFSMFRAGNFSIGSYVPGLVILILLIIGMCIQERFFCRFFCPLGAVFSLLPVLPFFALQRDRDNCLKGCRACTNVCPSDIELPKAGFGEVRGDCFQCGKCADTCPKSNVHCGIRKIRGSETVYTVIRAVILMALLIKVGI